MGCVKYCILTLFVLKDVEVLFHDDHAPETFPGGITEKKKKRQGLLSAQNFFFQA